MTCFDQAPEFIDEDNRRFRVWNPISKDQMDAKHEALLPPGLVAGKTILDLGCCLGATGHWCLSHGAAAYTGVEFQKDYTDTAQRLLEKYHPGKFAIEQQAIEPWLAKPRVKSFDIVCLLGVLFVFTDYYSVLKACAAAAREYFMIENLYPLGTTGQNKDFCGVQFDSLQVVNLAAVNASALGRGTQISPKGLQWLMSEFGFSAEEGVILPRPIVDVPDIYNRPLDGGFVRYLMRFKRTEDSLRSLSEDLQTGAMKLRVWK